MTLTPGSRLGAYDIVSLLGEGGMGQAGQNDGHGRHERRCGAGRHHHHARADLRNDFVGTKACAWSQSQVGVDYLRETAGRAGLLPTDAGRPRRRKTARSVR